MTHAGRSDDAGDDELERFLAEKREAWRGDLHAEDEPWQSEEDPSAWRGDAHLPDWPESSAGPEYWMYRRAAEGW